MHLITSRLSRRAPPPPPSSFVGFIFRSSADPTPTVSTSSFAADFADFAEFAFPSTSTTSPARFTSSVAHVPCRMRCSLTLPNPAMCSAARWMLPNPRLPTTTMSAALLAQYRDNVSRRGALPQSSDARTSEKTPATPTRRASSAARVVAFSHRSRSIFSAASRSSR